jgi:hypothetical protein
MGYLDLERRTIKAALVNAASTNIPTAFSTAAGSKVLTGIARGRAISIVNYTDTMLGVNYTHTDPTTAPTEVEGFVPPKGEQDFAASTKDGVQMTGQIYIQSMGAAITSGNVTIEVW